MIVKKRRAALPKAKPHARSTLHHPSTTGLESSNHAPKKQLSAQRASHRAAQSKPVPLTRSSSQAHLAGNVAPVKRTTFIPNRKKKIKCSAKNLRYFVLANLNAMRWQIVLLKYLYNPSGQIPDRLCGIKAIQCPADATYCASITMLIFTDVD